MSTSKIVLIVLAVVIGLPILACGGCLVLGGIATVVSPPPAAAPDNQNVVETAEPADSQVDDQPRPAMTMANFNRCRPGMTYDEVVAIVGPPTEVMSENEIAGIHTVMYSWKAGLVANANMTFQNGKLVSKAQFGL